MNIEHEATHATGFRRGAVNEEGTQPGDFRWEKPAEGVSVPEPEPAREERVDEALEQVHPARHAQVEQPQFQRSSVDVTGLLRAQGIFIRAQSAFLNFRPTDNPADFTNALGHYSRAQAELLSAQQEVLHQLGVL